MSILLKQSTAVVISFGPFLLNTDGVTLVTNLVGTGANQTENTSTGIRLSKNGGAFAARHATATASTYDAFGNYLVTLDTTDTGTLGTLRMQFANGAAFCPVWADFVVLAANVYDSLVGGGDILDVSVTQLLGTAWLTPGTAGTPDVNAKLIGATAQTGRDIGASVLLSSGTGTGQLDFTSGVVKANLAQILGTALTETAGLLAGGFKKFFNVATPTGTLNSIPDAVPDAVGGLPITGVRLTAIPTVAAVTTVTNLTNAPTAGDFTATMKISLNAATPVVTIAAAGVQAIWDALTSALTTSGSIGKLLVDNINATISSRLPTASYTAPLSAAQTEDAVWDAVQADHVAAGSTGESLNNAGSGGSVPTVQEIVDGVWDEPIADHLDAGSTGEALDNAGTAGDPWSTALPGAYGAGTAGNIVGNNLDVPISDIPTATENADALLKRDWSAVTGEASRSVLNALRFIRNKFSTTATPGFVTVYKENDSTVAYTKAVVTDASAQPIVEG